MADKVKTEFGNFSSGAGGSLSSSDVGGGDKTITFNKRISGVEKTTEETRTMMILGFKILLVMVGTMLFALAGLVFGYWQFTYQEGLKNKSDISEIQEQLSNLKNCMKYSPTYYPCVSQ